MTQEFVTLPREIVEQAIYALYCTNSQEGSPAYNFELKAVKELRAALEQSQGEQEPSVEHELKDVRCECCGYMTNHREHMGCIRAAHTKREPLTDEQARRIYNSATYSASLAVFMTRIDAEHPDADDKGVSGWLQEAEDRVKQRAIEAAHNIK